MKARELIQVCLPFLAIADGGRCFGTVRVQLDHRRGLIVFGAITRAVTHELKNMSGQEIVGVSQNLTPEELTAPITVEGYAVYPRRELPRE